MHDILHLVHIEAPPDQVYRALTTPEGIRAWWTRDAELETRVGGTGSFRFYERTRETRVRIEELVPGCRVAWSTQASFRPEWLGTTLAFDLAADGADTILRFAQRGFRLIDDGVAMTTTGWAYFLVSLRRYLETGTGAPSPDVDFFRMLR